MHLGNGAVTPACALVGLGAAALGAGLGIVMSRSARRPAPARFALGCAAVFAAQMFNVTVIPGQASGHMIGSFLLAYWFGPVWSLLGMTVVLAAQSLLFNDGGLATLGLNVLIMGVVPAFLAYPLWQYKTTQLQGAAWWIALAGGACLSVMLAAALCTAALLSRPDAREHAATLIPMMLGVHALVGLVEAAITVSAVALGRQLAPWRGWTAAGAALAGIVALTFTALWGASPWPDGLEFNLERLGLHELDNAFVEAAASLQSTMAPWSDYEGTAACLIGAASVLVSSWLIRGGHELSLGTRSKE